MSKLPVKAQSRPLLPDHEAARRALAKCVRISDVKPIRNLAIAAAAWAREAKDTTMIQRATEIRMCGRTFTARLHRVARGGGKYCSPKCWANSWDTTSRLLRMIPQQARDPVAQEKTRDMWFNRRMAHDFLRELLGAEMLDELLKPFGKHHSARYCAAYELMRHTSNQDLALLALSSVKRSLQEKSK
jgi:hypothetical protein